MSNDATNEITIPSSILTLINDVQKELELPHSVFDSRFMDQLLIAALLKGKSAEVKEKVTQDFDRYSKQLAQVVQSNKD
ncbi:hypothetical protein [Thalassotalea ganghwensis]